jgi:hypothetical protein
MPDVSAESVTQFRKAIFASLEDIKTLDLVRLVCQASRTRDSVEKRDLADANSRIVLVVTDTFLSCVADVFHAFPVQAPADGASTPPGNEAT